MSKKRTPRPERRRGRKGLKHIIFKVKPILNLGRHSLSSYVAAGNKVALDVYEGTSTRLHISFQRDEHSKICRIADLPRSVRELFRGHQLELGKHTLVAVGSTTGAGRYSGSSIMLIDPAGAVATIRYMPEHNELRQQLFEQTRTPRAVPAEGPA